MGIENKDFSEKVEDCSRSIDAKLQILSDRVDNPYEKKSREIWNEPEKLTDWDDLEKQLEISFSDKYRSIPKAEEYYIPNHQYIDSLKKFWNSELSLPWRIKAYTSITDELPYLPKSFETFFADA